MMEDDQTRPTAGPMASARDRMSRLGEVVWPGQAVTRRRGLAPSGDSPSWTVLPTWDRPRLILPSEPRAARAVLAAFAGSRDPVSRIRTRGLAALTHGLVPTDRAVLSGSPAPGSQLLDLAREALGTDVDDVGIRLGSARPNQKPVAVFTAAGEAVAFAKIGWNALTRHLVEAESQALRDLASRPDAPGGIRVPAVLSQVEWHGSAVLIMEALRVDGATPSQQQVVSAMRWIAGTTSDTDLSEWLTTIVEPRLAAVDDQELVASVVRLVERARSELGETPLVQGSWHGDFRPWNLGVSGSTLAAWDWERHRDGVLVGMDAIHLHFPVPGSQSDLDSWLDLCDTRAAQSMRLLPGLGLGRQHVTALRAGHAVELLLREFEDVAIQPDVARPGQAAALLRLLEGLVEASS